MQQHRVAAIVVLAKQELPDEGPGVFSRPISDGNPGQLAWIAQETAPSKPNGSNESSI
jgi:hypothetical protein